MLSTIKIPIFTDVHVDCMLTEQVLHF